MIEVLALEHRVRRDLLVDDADLEAFFEARLPLEITTGRRFDRWWRDERGRRPELLTYTIGDLVDASAGEVTPDAYPEWVRVGDADVALTYTFDPSAELDGVTVDVPLLLVDQVEAARLDWHVPGMREELDRPRSCERSPRRLGAWWGQRPRLRGWC